MITCKTFIRAKSVPPYTFSPEKAENFFIDMEDDKGLEQLREIFQKQGNVYGSIIITYEGSNIVSYDVIERFPLYWMIWFDLLRNYILKIDHQDRFTDIEQYFALIQLGGEIELYCYDEDFIVTLPEKEFLLAMLEGYQNFHQHYSRMVSVSPDLWRKEEAEELIAIVEEEF